MKKFCRNCLTNESNPYDILGQCDDCRGYKIVVDPNIEHFVIHEVETTKGTRLAFFNEADAIYVGTCLESGWTFDEVVERIQDLSHKYNIPVYDILSERIFY